MYYYTKNYITAVKFNNEMPELIAIGYKQISEYAYNYIINHCGIL